MSDVTGTLGRPIQGVSNQPQKTRQIGQCSKQINCQPSVVSGLSTRIGSNIIGGIDAIPDDSFIHFYKRDSQEAYMVILTGGDIPLVYDLDGVKQHVTFTGQGQYDYVTTGSLPAYKRFAVQTIGDSTFIVNREVGVLGQGQTQDTPEGAVFNMAYATYGRTYRMTVTGAIDSDYVEVVMPDGDQAAEILDTDTSKVAKQLYDLAVVKWPAFGFILDRNYIFAAKNDGTAFEPKTRDGAKGGDFIVAYKTVSKIADVPAVAPDGMILAVKPEGGNSSNTIYLKATSADGKTAWSETTAGSIVEGFDVDTMPQELVRESIINGIGQFKLSYAPWLQREVGNDDTNPMPSFYDATNPKTINNIGTFQNRLFFLSGESVIMTRSDEYYDFFRYSAQKAVDTDPIAIFSDARQVNTLTEYANINGSLVFFSDNAQFLLAGNIPQTKETATLSIITEYECLSTVKPASSGENVYFAYTYGRYGAIRELYTDSFASTKRARPITAHVNTYIEGELIKMTASTNINTMFCLTKDTRNTLWVYDWEWQADQKVQSAWHEWSYPTGTRIVSMQYIGETLYVVSNDESNNSVFEKFEMGNPYQYGLTEHIRMDRQYQTNFTYDSNDELWISEDMQYLPSDLGSIELVTIDADTSAGNFLTVPCNINNNKFKTGYRLSTDTSRTVKVIVGEMFEALYEPTQIYIMDYKGHTSSLDTPTVGSLYFNFDKVSTFSVNVTDVYNYSEEYYFTNRRIGRTNNIVGFAKSIEMSEEVPVRRKADDIIFQLKSRSYIPFQLRDIEWTGIYLPKRRKV